MAIAGDAATKSGNDWTTGTSSLTWSHTCTGSNLFLVVGVATFDGSALRTVSGITYNGVALTKVNSITAALEASNQDAELWYLDGPATGANNIVVTLSGSTGFVFGEAASYTGKTVSGIDANNTAQNTSTSTSSPTCNVNVNHSDCWLVGFAYSRYAGTLTAGAATTLGPTSLSGHAYGDSGGVVGTGNQTLAFTAGSAATWPGICSASISTANAGGGGGGGVTYSQLERGIRGLNRGVAQGSY